jgi:lipase
VAQLDTGARDHTAVQPPRRMPGAGVELAVSTWAGPDPVVAVHGLSAQSRNWAAVAAGLQGRHGLIAPDLRGRGDSDKPAQGYGVEAHAADVAAMMRGLGLGPSVVVGHSMGAYIAAALAATEPELVRGLMLLDGGYPQSPPPGLDPDQLLEAILAPMVARLHTTYASRQEYIDFWRAQPAFPPGHWNRYVEEYVAYDLGGEAPRLQPKASETGVREDFRAICDQANARRHLEKVRCPMVVVRAEHGLTFGAPPVVTDEIAALVAEIVLGGAEDVPVPGSTHYTIAFSEPGVSVVVDRLAQLAERTRPR